MEIENYTLHRKLMKDGQLTFDLTPNNPLENCALTSKTRVIYLVKDNKDWLYVGEAKANLKKRIQSGFYSYRRYKRTNVKYKGYGGYKWVELFDESSKLKTVDKLYLFAIIFDKNYNNDRKSIEAIEGELVYLIRRETGKWPLFQNEIHFSNENAKSVHIATEIMQLI